MAADPRDPQQPSTDTEPAVVTRSVALDRPADALWSMVGDGERWADWMVDDSAVVVTPGREGTVRDDGTERRVAIRSVEPGRAVRFDWWPSDQPGGASTVELVVEPAVGEEAVSQGGSSDGGSVLRITETFPAGRRPGSGGLRASAALVAPATGAEAGVPSAAFLAWAVRAVVLFVWSHAAARARA